jgi:hypothetical protein
LDIDATLVSLLLGTGRTGNMVGFLDHSGYMVVLPASLFANMSLALLSWVTITQWFNHRWATRDFSWAGLACLTVITVNVTRISLMGLSHRHYEAIHSTCGDITNSIMLALMVGMTVLGARREIFARA